MSGMSEPVRNPRGDATLKQFARQIARLQRDIRNLEAANQITSASIEGGALEVYDDDDILRERIGRQQDGSYGRLTVDGPVPPAPTEPDVVVIDNGVVAITWDGRCEEKWPFTEFRNVRVHMDDTEDFTPSRDNQVGSIHAHRGGTIVAVTESDDDNPIWVRLVAVSTAGHTSDPSPSVLVDELDEEDLEEEPEELQWEDGDGWTITAADIAAGTVTFPLSHIPEVESLLAWWHPGGLGYAGVPQAPGVDFTVDPEAQTVTWPLTGCEAAGDRLRVYYPYYDLGRSLGFQATGWRYLTVTEADTTDRSTPGFDDSTWATGQGAFGNLVAGDGTPFANGLGWPAPNTVIGPPVNVGVWIRQSIDVIPAGAQVTLSLRVDGDATAFWNGVNVGTRSSNGTTEVADITIPGSSVTGSDVLAVHLVDDTADPTYDFLYIDARIEW